MALSLLQWGGHLFHITHEKNLPSILAKGVYSKNEAKRHKLVYHSIADPGIQIRRQATQVPVGHGGTIHDYVPLYFGARSPMLYAVKSRVPQHEIVYLLVRWDVLQLPSTVFSDGNLATLGTRFFCGAQDLDQVDRDAVAEIYWVRPAELRRKKAAEVLVWKHVPVCQIAMLAVMNDAARLRASAILQAQKLALSVLEAKEFYYV